MDDKLAKDLLEMGARVLNRLADVEKATEGLRLLLKGNGHDGFLRRIEKLEQATFFKRPEVYIALASMVIVLYGILKDVFGW